MGILGYGSMSVNAMFQQLTATWCAKLTTMAGQDPWQRFRTLKRATLIGVPVFFVTFAILALGWMDMRSRAVYLFFGWMIFAMVMLILTHEVRCPRCNKRFYVKDVFSQMTTECLHCGQQKYGDVGTPTKPNGQ
jgi:hypothetical protein